MGTNYKYYNTQSLGKRLLFWIKVQCWLLGITVLIIGIQSLMAMLNFDQWLILGLMERLCVGVSQAIDIFLMVNALIWIYRGNSNCHHLGIQNMVYRPVLSVIYCFIPFMNLYYIPQILQEIWRGISYPAQATNRWIQAWGAAWAITQLLSIWLLSISPRYSRGSDNTLLWAVSDMLTLGFFLLSLRVISQIQAQMDTRQTQVETTQHEPRS